MEKDTELRLRAILTAARAQPWDNPSFDLARAQVCAELSALVYKEVKEYELKRASRIHLFASDAFRRQIEAKQPSAPLSTLVSEQFDARTFLVSSRYAITFGVILPKVVLIAIRGTVFLRLWDWRANVDCRRLQVRPDWNRSLNGALDAQIFFHQGFFEAIVPQLETIAHHLHDVDEVTQPLVWTGHSLGGAMAAVGHYLTQQKSDVDSQSAYTFGMPRFGSIGAVCAATNVHHIYKERDVVPTLPTRRMGFADAVQEYAVGKDGKIELTERTDTFGPLSHIPRIFSSIAAHSIEGYAESVAVALKSPRLGS
jgi:predicted lipase